MKLYVIGKVEEEIAVVNALFHNDHTQFLTELSMYGYFNVTHMFTNNMKIVEDIVTKYGHYLDKLKSIYHWRIDDIIRTSFVKTKQVRISNTVESYVVETENSRYIDYIIDYIINDV